MNTKNLATLPYRLVRTPLAIVDFKLVHRLPEDSRPRLVIERAIGSVDRLAGRLLHDDSLARIGTDRIANADKLDTALGLEADAAERRRAASETALTAAQEASQKRAQAADRKTAAAAEAAETERKAKQAAAAKARAQATKAKQQVATRANQKLSTIAQGLKQTEAVAEAREHQAEKQAKAELADAAKEKRAARSARADADQLGELATAKKTARKSS
jgi:hypothetical protein